MTPKTLECKFTEDETRRWETLQAEQLVDVVSGGQVQQSTRVMTCWDGDAVYFRFECVDDHTVADYTQRDDPLYEQDVVEVFIDEEGTGRHYIELELSPLNVVFDARVDNEDGRIRVHTEWDADGMETKVWNEGDIRLYEIRLPFIHFSRRPEAGTLWRINFYRIDEDRNNKRHYQAWSPTGAVNYHIPSRFGTLLFVE